MEVGNRIQFYRKRLGMSQEELGKKLFVSRQTVSLWEKGQTMPTIENLIRLKEIFGVSIDDIIGSNENVQQYESNPIETYYFKYTEREFKQIYKFMKLPLINRSIVFFVSVISVMAFLVLISILNDTSDYEIIFAFFMGILCVGGSIYLKQFSAYRKKWKKSKSKLIDKTYEYQIFNDYFSLNKTDDNGNKKSITVYFDNIEQIYNYKNYFLISSFGQLFIFKRDEMICNSEIYLSLRNKPSAVIATAKDNIRKTISVLLNIASWLSLLFGFFLVASLTENAYSFTDKMWLLFIMIPIPVASLIFSIVITKKGYKFKSNLVSGIIVSIILCIFGSFSFIFNNAYDHSNKPIAEIEQYLNTDIPEYSDISTMNYDNLNQVYTGGCLIYESYISFDDEASESLESYFKDDIRWLKNIPNYLNSITLSNNELQFFDYIMVYNIEYENYNTLPEKAEITVL